MGDVIQFPIAVAELQTLRELEDWLMSPRFPQGPPAEIVPMLLTVRKQESTMAPWREQ